LQRPLFDDVLDEHFHEAAYAACQAADEPRGWRGDAEGVGLVEETGAGEVECPEADGRAVEVGGVEEGFEVSEEWWFGDWGSGASGGGDGKEEFDGERAETCEAAGYEICCLFFGRGTRGVRAVCVGWEEASGRRGSC